MSKLRVILPKKWLEFDEIKDKVEFPTVQNKIEQLEKYIEVREQECDNLQDTLKDREEYITHLEELLNRYEEEHNMIETEEGDVLFPVTEDYHILSIQSYCRIDRDNKHIITTIVDYVKGKKHYRKVFENMLEGDNK